MLKKLKLKSKVVLRNIYAGLICPQKCLLCGTETNCGLPICSACTSTEIEGALNFRLKNEEKFCKKCGRFLISEKEYCTNCRTAILKEKNLKDEKNEPIPQSCDRIFSIYPYQGKCGQLLVHWKNFSVRGFAEVFAKSISCFVNKKEELQNIKIVPVPPRPKKIKNKGWDQIEDTAVQLEHIYDFKILRCLKRKDGTAQKTLSREKRKTNLKGKIFIKNAKQMIPETLIILDDVMTTGATLNFCAAALKEAGCKKVYGLCLFFD
ncbi:ComF family protein [Treponema pedis]|uniref:ComF-like protein n=1 Tax=Treponema pedis str. T A4 TaxID=1291379 RepID=S5ZYG4_9SPIR|nr:ComF family protein [Treponema pedis]AGT43083.1 ComF-like protein [Treponema pedis str. T A4]